ncbi:MAG: hypothetical protein IT353_18890 [Gemmatimonadaceae bacterium]|nr:hypothetical protein [Gemmatimonadaceae bacterium]
MSRDNDNIAGFSWGFTIWVTLKKNGRYSVGATCYSNEPPTPRYPTAYPLNTGEQVWKAIRELFECIEEYEPPLDLDEARDIVRSLEKHDPAIAAQVWGAAEAALIEDEADAAVDATHDVGSAPKVETEGRTCGVPLIATCSAAIVYVSPPTTASPPSSATLATYTPEEQALLNVMRRTRGDEFVDRHAALILAQAYQIGDL